MGRDAAEVIKDALALPPEARSALIDSLVQSLDQGRDPVADEAWREEICRRLQQIDSGTATAIPWDDARRRLRAQVAG